jgi:hypothetical protein
MMFLPYDADAGLRLAEELEPLEDTDWTTGVRFPSVG